MDRLDGKAAIVTGAGGGIGAATAAAMAQLGARVLLADVDMEAAERAAQPILASGAEARVCRADLAEETSIRGMIDAALQAFGRLDVLHNNAADQSPALTSRDGDIEAMEPEVWDRVFHVNARGTMLCCKHALPLMVAQGGGSIINTASNLGLQGSIVQAAYGASKAAILQLTRSIAASHGKKGVRCNAVSPGLTLSPAALANLPAALRDIVEAETLTPYLGEPRDIAGMVAFLASDAARYITGQNIIVDGGTSTHIPGLAALRELFNGTAP